MPGFAWESKEEEVKNDRRIEFELPGHVAAMIDRHLQTRSPYLCPAGVPTIGYGSTRYADGRRVTRLDRATAQQHAVVIAP